MRINNDAEQEQNFLVTFFMNIAKDITQVIGAVIISRIIFPVMYLALLELLAKGVAHLIRCSGKTTISLERLA